MHILTYISLLARSVNTASILAENINYATLISELVICLLLIVLLVLVRNRMFKIICACGAEVCLWLACKVAFGPDALLSQIMTWVTALAVIALMIAIVNRIDWGSMRSKKH